VEWTTGDVFLATLFEWHIGIDKIDDIAPSEQFIDKVLGDGTRHM
jgi:hypothetical protein